MIIESVRRTALTTYVFHGENAYDYARNRFETFGAMGDCSSSQFWFDVAIEIMFVTETH